MEPKYIVAIVVLGLFLILMFISVVIIERGRIRDVKLRAWISKKYNDEEVKKYDYDTDDVDDEIPLQKIETSADEPMDEVEAVVEEPHEEVYGKIDVEGIEEITGNYKDDE